MNRLFQLSRKTALLRQKSQWEPASRYLQYLSITEKESYSVLEMKKEPVNSLSLEMCNEVIEALDTLEQNQNVRGVIITSPLKVFCAGLDILEMHNPKEERIKLFWQSVQEMTYRLFSSPLVMISAINGPSPAGGCIFPFSSDYRIMADGKFPIGLNEVHLGIVAPFFLSDALKDLVGYRKAEEMLGLGIMYHPQDALKYGMIDEVVAKDNLLETAEKHMAKYLSIPEFGRVKTKQLMRKDYLSNFSAKREDDLSVFLEQVATENVQHSIQKYLQSLKKR